MAKKTKEEVVNPSIAPIIPPKEKEKPDKPV